MITHGSIKPQAMGDRYILPRHPLGIPTLSMWKFIGKIKLGKAAFRKIEIEMLMQLQFYNQCGSCFETNKK